MTMQHHIAILGGTTFDHIIYLPQLPEPVAQTIHKAPFNEAVGSTGSGKALALTKLGMPNTLYAVVGDDLFGEKIKTFFKEQAVQTIFDIDPAGTERHVNIMDEQGGRISIFVTQSSEQVSYNSTAVEELLQQSTIIVLNIVAYCRQLIPLVKKTGKPVWTDLHDYDGHNPYHEDFIDAAQFIHLSSDNLPDYKKVMLELMNRGKQLVICTHGKQGATLLTKKGEWIEQPILEHINIVDSNGAGDSFFSGFLFAFLHDFPLEKCMRYGAICGAYAVTSSQLVYEKLTPSFVENLVSERDRRV